MKNLIKKYYRLRSKYWRMKRILFPSPAELRFIEIMGGKVVRFKKIKSRKSGFCLAIIYSLGAPLNDERFKREKRVGRYFVDFGNDICIGIEIDGKQWHRDVVKEFERDSYFYQLGWRIKRIDAIRVFNSPDKVQREVLQFLYK